MSSSLELPELDSGLNRSGRKGATPSKRASTQKPAPSYGGSRGGTEAELSTGSARAVTAGTPSRASGGGQDSFREAMVSFAEDSSSFGRGATLSRSQSRTLKSKTGSRKRLPSMGSPTKSASESEDEPDALAKASGYVYLTHRAQTHHKVNRTEIAQRKQKQVQTLLDKVSAQMLSPAGLAKKSQLQSSGQLKGLFQDDMQAMLDADRANFEMPTQYWSHLQAKLHFLLRELGDTDERLNAIQGLYENLQTESRIMEREHMVLRARLEETLETMQKHDQNYRDGKVAYENQIAELSATVQKLIQERDDGRGKGKSPKAGSELDQSLNLAGGGSYAVGKELTSARGAFMEQQIREWSRQKRAAVARMKDYEDKIQAQQLEVMDLQAQNEQLRKELQQANQEPLELRARFDHQAEQWRIKEQKMREVIQELTSIKESYLSLQAAYAEIQIQTDERMEKARQLCVEQCEAMLDQVKDNDELRKQTVARLQL
eukprot:RCo005217